MPPKKKAVAQGNTQADLIAAINAQFGAGAITLASDQTLAVTRWATGVLPIDHILDGGVARGRFIEIFGPYSTLKSLVAYKALGTTQKNGGRVALIDTEHSFDPDWATDLGVDVKTLMVCRPETAEQGIGIMEALIRQKYDMVVFDSIASAIPKQHQEVAPGEDNQPGALARVMSKGLARLNAANTQTAAIFINQTRQKIGVTFGSPVTTSGGLAMGFYASARLSFTRIGKITEPTKKWDGEKFVDAKKVIGHKILATLEKSKLSAPHTDAYFVFDLRTGEVDDRGYLVAQGIERGYLTRTTTGMYDIPGVLDKPIHGKAKFDAYMDDNEEVEAWLLDQMMA